MRIHPPSRLVADAGRGLQIRQARHLHPARRPEMVQQRPLPSRPNPLDLIQLTLPDGLRPPRPVRRDRKAVRLIPQPLQEIQHRITRRKLERRHPIGMQPLLLGVPVRPLDDDDQLDIL